MPERFAEWEKLEEEIATVRGKKVSILNRRVGGKRIPYTLTELRLGVDASQVAQDSLGCGCFTAEETDE
jgi:hypothetical protein